MTEAPVVGAWYIAVERYTASLPAEYRQAFNAPANAEDCLLLIEKAAARGSKFDRLACLLRPLVAPLKRFETSIDVLVQTSSLFLCPVWGPLRCVIGLISDRLGALSSVTTLLQRLVEPLRRFEGYERLFAESVALRVAVGALYGDLIEFCARVVAHCSSRSVLRKSFGSFDRDVDEISGKIRYHWNEVDTVANAVHLSEAKAARQLEEAQRELDLRKDINRWLAPSVVDDDLCKLQAAYLDGSCDWILETAQYARLVAAPGFHSLRVFGHPGGGKSTAASFLAKRHLQLSKDPLLYFFCKATDAEKSFTINILRTFVFHLLRSIPLLCSQIVPSYYSSGRSVLDSESEAYALFEILIQSIADEGTPIYIIIDAVDECHDAPALLQALFATKATGIHLKLIIFAREDAALTPLLQDCDDCLALHSQSEPLNRYIEERVSKLGSIMPIDEVLRKSVTANVINASAGLWLFARLLLDEIERAPSTEEIQRQLQNIPHGLIELYTSMLKAKEKRFTETQLKMVQQLYLWLDTSDYLPAWVWEGTSGDSLEDAMIACILKFACSSSQIFNPLKLVQNLCTPLVQSRIMHPAHKIHCAGGHSEDDAMFAAEFFHQTAKQYLRWSVNAATCTVPASLRLRRLGPLHRGICAAWYFGESPEFYSSLRILRDRPRDGHFDCFIQMACGLWQSLNVSSFAKDIDVEDVAEAGRMCEQLYLFITTDRCLAFLEATFIFSFSSAARSLIPWRTFDSMTDETTTVSLLHPARSSALQKLENAQLILMGDLAYIIAAVRLAGNIPQVLARKTVEKPAGFDGRPLAKKMFDLARRYQWLCVAPKATSSNCFLISPKK